MTGRTRAPRTPRNIPPIMGPRGWQFRARVKINHKMRLGPRRDTIAETLADLDHLRAEHGKPLTPVLTLDDGIAMLDRSMAKRGLRPLTVRLRTERCRFLRGFFGGRRTLRSITPQDVEGYVAHRLAQPGVYIDNGGDLTDHIPFDTDATGHGCGSWSVPTSGWGLANFNTPGAEEVTVTHRRLTSRNEGIGQGRSGIGSIHGFLVGGARVCAGWRLLLSCPPSPRTSPAPGVGGCSGR